jgi:hypothetical protein
MTKIGVDLDHILLGCTHINLGCHSPYGRTQVELAHLISSFATTLWTWPYSRLTGEVGVARPHGRLAAPSEWLRL